MQTVVEKVQVGLQQLLVHSSALNVLVNYRLILGFHRELGVHITKVKSVNLDKWKPEELNLYAKLSIFVKIHR